VPRAFHAIPPYPTAFGQRVAQPSPGPKPNLPPEDNPAVDDVRPEEIREEDNEKSHAPDRTSGEGPVPEEPTA
jgi:hypothetical protein